LLELFDKKAFIFCYRGKKYRILSRSEDYGDRDNRPHMLEEVETLLRKAEYSLFEMRLQNGLNTGYYKEIK
jgi:hypothetical protein